MTYKPTRDIILSDIMEQLYIELDIDISKPGTAASSLANAFTNAITGTSRILDNTLHSYYPNNARGAALDRIGQSFGVSRLSSAQSFARDTDEAVFIKAKKGTLRAAIGNILPANTEFSNSAGTKTFFVPEDISIPSNTTTMPVSVVSKNTGVTSAVNAGEVNTHTLGSRIEVVNTQPINNGGSIENDATYRNRVLSAIRGSSTGSIEYLRSVANSVSGVQNAILLPDVGGIGKFGILIIPTGNYVSNRTISLIRSLLTGIAPAGVSPVIVVPNYMTVKLSASMIFSTTATDEEKSRIKETAKAQALRALGSSQPGTTFSLQELYRSILSTAGSSVLDIKTECFEIDNKETTNGVVTLGPREIMIPANISNAVTFGG